MNEAIRRAKVEQQRQNRQKFFNKSSSAYLRIHMKSCNLNRFKLNFFLQQLE